MKRSRRQSILIRLLLVCVLATVAFYGWRLNHVLSMPLRQPSLPFDDTDVRRDIPLIPAQAEVHIHLLPHHSTATASPSAAPATHVPRPTKALSYLALHAVQTVLFEDPALWMEDMDWAMTNTSSRGATPSTNATATIVCDVSESWMQQCTQLFKRSSKQRRVFSVLSVRSAKKTSDTTAKIRESSVRGSISSFVSGGDEIVGRLSDQAERMRSVSLQRTKVEGGAVNVEALLQNISRRTAASLSGTAMSSDSNQRHGTEQLELRCLADVPSIAAIASADLRLAVPAVRIISGTLLSQVALDDSALKRILRSATLVAIVLDEMTDGDGVKAKRPFDSAETGPDRMFSLEMLSALFENQKLSDQCSFSAVHDVEEQLERPAAVLIRCKDAPHALPSCAESGGVTEHLDGRKQVDHMQEGTAVSNATLLDRRLPLRCKDSDAPLELTTSIKWGTKTAIFKGRYRERSVAVKMFHVDQYASFRGFHALISHNVRSPYINYPSSSCLDDERQSIFQLQPFLGKGSTLLAFMKKEGKQLPWSHRIELALQVACTFYHLHTHPMGFFTFDDNHPEQYFVKEVLNPKGGRQYLKLTMVDIDTLQLGVVASTVMNATAIRIRCRCFYCHGKSDCLFINSIQGYRACGQWAGDPSHGDKEDLSRVAAGSQCDGTNDFWFLAQLLYLVGKGSVAWGHAMHEDVVARLARGEVPTLETTEPLYNSLVEDMFRARVTDRTMVERLKVLCRMHNCHFVEGCDRDVRAGPLERYRSPLLLNE